MLFHKGSSLGEGGIVCTVRLIIMVLFFPLSSPPLLPPFRGSDVQTNVKKNAWVPGKILLVARDGQEPLTREGGLLTVHLDANASRFFLHSTVDTHTSPKK